MLQYVKLSGHTEVSYLMLAVYYSSTVGTDVRKLARDGYPAANILGCDLRQAFIDLGFGLYQDKATNQINFFVSDIFDVPTVPPPASTDVPVSEITELTQLKGRLTHVYTGALFHLFDEATQYALALRIGMLLKRDAGAIVFGRHQGLERAGSLGDYISEYVALVAFVDSSPSNFCRVRFGHSPESWPQLWKKVFTELEGEDFVEKRVVVSAFLAEALKHGVQSRMLYWSVRVV
jgi:hypothetical protein